VFFACIAAHAAADYSASTTIAQFTASWCVFLQMMRVGELTCWLDTVHGVEYTRPQVTFLHRFAVPERNPPGSVWR
jgi:hypothetical protein